MTSREPRRRALSSPPGWAAQLLLLAGVVAVTCAVVISRRPDAFTRPQFYAEDGTVWFSDAYNQGPWQSAFLSYQGHFLLQPRLVALVAAPFGISSAPFVYNLFGLLFQIAPVVFFMSRRFQPLLPPLWYRAILSAVYLLMPSTELNVDVASAQFHLAILATLVLVAPPPDRWGWRVFDVATMALCALTGAFVYILLPVALLWWWLRKQRSTAVLCVILLVGLGRPALRHGAGPAHRRPARSQPPRPGDHRLRPGDPGGALRRGGQPTHLFVAGLPDAAALALAICLLSLPARAFAGLRAPWELRFFALAAGGIAAAGRPSRWSRRAGTSGTSSPTATRRSATS